MSQDTSEKSGGHDKSKVEFDTVTLKDLGPTLPLGLKDSNGAYRRSIKTKPFTMKEEKQLGTEREANTGMNAGQYVSVVLATICSELGGIDFDSISQPTRRVHINQMYMGDVFYAYCWIRKEALGNILPMKLSCIHCLHKFDFDADLSTMKVAVAKTEEGAHWKYALETPMEIRGKAVSELIMGPARWAAMESMGEEGIGVGVAKAGIIQGSLMEAVGLGKTPIASNELDGMVKKDIELLTNSIDDNVMGPDMSIDTTCQRCYRNFVAPIRWTYDHFFGTSSR